MSATVDAPVGEPAPPRPRRQLPAVELIVVAMLLLLLVRERLPFVDQPAVRTWSTVFVSLCFQALPFLVLGVVLSGALTAFVPQERLQRLLPRRGALAVPTAGIAGLALPGCECGSVPIAGSLVRGGVAPAAALTFLLSAPAINPVVLVSTAVAFPGRPDVVGARFLASLLTAVVMGWLWLRFGKLDWLVMRRLHAHGADGPRWQVFLSTVRHDFLHAGGFLVIGGITAATINGVVSDEALDGLAGSLLLSTLVLAGLAVVLAICSEADAFVAASLTEFSPSAKLAFMVVGPMVDLKLVALQAGTFGRGFAVRFAPATLVVAITSSVLVSWWLL